MINNIGTVSNVSTIDKLYNANLGDTLTFTSTDPISLISGELGTGFLIYLSKPDVGVSVMGVVTDYTDAETDYTVKILSKAINIPNLLSRRY